MAVAVAVFGVELRRRRQEAALSLRQLADRVGYDHSYLSQVERGRRPGSAQLAQRCDRVLGTGAALTDAYERVRPPPHRSLATVAATSTEVTLEATRLGLAGSLGQVADADEWVAVAARYERDYSTTPPAELLADLAADLELLRATVATGPASSRLAVPAARLATLMALTMAALGRSRTAWRWWRTALDTADRSGHPETRSLVRSCTAAGGLTDRQALPELLDLADEAAALADRPSCAAQATAARARILALLHQDRAARRALRDLSPVSTDSPDEVSVDTSLFACTAYRVQFVSSYVYTVIGDSEAAYDAQDRAFDLRPAGETREGAELQLHRACCLVRDGEVGGGLATAMRALVELPDHWHTEFLYDAAGRVLSAVPAVELGRPAVRDYRQLLSNRPYRSV